MSAVNGTMAMKANSGTAKVCGQPRNTLRTTVAVMQKVRDLFPNKTALHLVDITGYSQRACEYWLSGDARLPADALVMLLRSDHGLEFLQVLMDGSQVSWWRKLAAYFATIEAVRLQKAARRKLQEAMDADGDLAARSDALLQQDEAFYRPHADAVRDVVRASRGVARQRRR